MLILLLLIGSTGFLGGVIVGASHEDKQAYYQLRECHNKLEFRYRSIPRFIEPIQPENSK